MAQSRKQESDVPVRRGFLSEVDPFRDFFDSAFRLPRALGRPAGALSQMADWAPAMDVQESKDAYVVSVELAGTKKDDISIECHDKLLTIKGEKKSEREEQDEHRHYTERIFGTFSRSLRLPADASDNVKASFREGVLTVEVPKVEERKPKVVAIE